MGISPLPHTYPMLIAKILCACQDHTHLTSAAGTILKGTTPCADL